MVDHSAWRLELARRYIEPYAERAPIAVLGGSVAQGVADRWSDVDTLVWDAVEDRAALGCDVARNGLGLQHDHFRFHALGFDDFDEYAGAAAQNLAE